MTDEIDAAHMPRGFFARLSTGVKMFVVLSLALMPLGLIAVYSSFDTANQARETRINEARLIAQASARQLSSAIARDAISLRAATTALAFGQVNTESCEGTLRSLAGLERYVVRFAIFDSTGTIFCATNDFAPAYMTPAEGGRGILTELDSEQGAVRFVVAGANRRAIGIAELPAETIAALTNPLERLKNFQMELSQEGRAYIIHPWADPRLANHAQQVVQPIANGQLTFSADFESVPLRNTEALSIALPIIMWMAAAFFGWLVVSRMLLQPLARLQRAVDRYEGDSRSFALPYARTPAQEIRQLGTAFAAVVEKLNRNERELEAGLVEQTRLTREVHHRVKNNLQVVASLLSLHARTAETPDKAAAYTSIQRRVDALAIVQRNLFAELDSSSGLPIRPVIAELASGLHQSAPSTANIAITLDIDNVRVSQDTAVPVAFLITELVELVIRCAIGGTIHIKVTEGGEPNLAQLQLVSKAFTETSQCQELPRYERVLSGLARQLRSTLKKSDDGMQYAIIIPTL